jgi:hypothetical protein
MALREELDLLVTALRDAGLNADLDAQNLTPPAVWVQLESIAHSILSGGMVLRCRLYAIVGDGPTGTVLDNLDALYETVLDVVTPNTDTDTTVAGVVLPDTSTPLPALQLTVDLPTTPY